MQYLGHTYSKISFVVYRNSKLGALYFIWGSRPRVPVEDEEGLPPSPSVCR